MYMDNLPVRPAGPCRHVHIPNMPLALSYFSTQVAVPTLGEAQGWVLGKQKGITKHPIHTELTGSGRPYM